MKLQGNNTEFCLALSRSDWVLFSRDIDRFHDLFSGVLFYQVLESVAILSMSVIMLITTPFTSQPITFLLKTEYVLAMLIEVGGFYYLGSKIHCSVCQNFDYILNLTISITF